MPHELGSVTFKAAETATAASATQVLICEEFNRDTESCTPAFPPFLNISSPTSVASGWDVETTPLVPKITERRLGKR